ncbi:MAG: bifunctional nuclease family protein [Flavobacteriales bacterium]|nr:bifunctional nuclease family protein [Flavobacteriales bacterium]
MEKIQLDIVGLSYSQTQSGAYALVLAEAEGRRRLPIIIGGFEAQAIAIELESMAPSRPLTHDLFKSFAEEFEIQMTEVIVYNLVEGIFFAKIICNQNGKEVEIDSRTSDAIALAVRFNCPIYTFEFILGSAGIILEDEDSDELLEEDISLEELVSESDSDSLSSVSIAELEEELKTAIAKEDYENASRLRDEIDRRKSQ